MRDGAGRQVRGRAWGLGVAALVLALAALGPHVAQAQSASELAAARALFEQGLEATREARWDDAVAAFERSYAVAPRPSTLLNLAGAEAERGRLVSASEMLRRVCGEPGEGERGARLREQAQAALDALLARIAHLRVETDAPLGDEDALRIDDEAVSWALVGVDIPIDPGAHRVTLARGDRVGPILEVTLADGESRVVRPTWPARVAPTPTAVRAGGATASASAASVPVAAPPEAVRPDGAASSDAPVVDAPWFWPVVGVAAALVVGGVVAGAVVASEGSAPPTYQGNLGDGQIRF